MSDEETAEGPVEDVAKEAPPTEEPASDADPSETVVEEPEEERDPLEVLWSGLILQRRKSPTKRQKSKTSANA